MLLQRRNVACSGSHFSELVFDASVGHMWLPTPTPEHITALRAQMEPEFSVDLTEEQWANYTAQLLQTFYLLYLHIPERPMEKERRS